MAGVNGYGKPGVSPYGRYRETQVLSASPGELVVLLYDGLVRFIESGRQSIARGETEAAHKALTRAQDIVFELMATLNMEVELSRKLYALYSFWVERLIEANLRKDATLVEPILEMAKSLRDAWSQAERSQGAKPEGSGKTKSVDVRIK